MTSLQGSRQMLTGNQVGERSYLSHEMMSNCINQLLLAGIGAHICKLIVSPIPLQSTGVQFVEVKTLHATHQKNFNLIHKTVLQDLSKRVVQLR